MTIPERIEAVKRERGFSGEQKRIPGKSEVLVSPNGRDRDRVHEAARFFQINTPLARTCDALAPGAL